MNLQERLKAYCQKYDEKTQDKIENFIKNGGNILAIFEDIENRHYFDTREGRYFDTYSYMSYEKYEKEEKERRLRFFQLFAMLAKPENIVGFEKLWVEEVHRENPKLAAYLYIRANFRYNIVKGIRGYEDVGQNEHWYLIEDDRYEAHIEELYHTTKEEEIKLEIQFCRYIKEKKEEQIKQLMQKVIEHQEKKENKENSYMLLGYYLYKTGKLQDEYIANQGFSQIHKELQSLTKRIKEEKCEDFYIDEYRYMSSAFEVSKENITIVAKTMISDGHFNNVDFEKVIFTKAGSLKLIEVIEEFTDIEDIGNTLTLYAILIKKLENKDIYITNFEKKIEKLLLEGMGAKYKESPVEIVENILKGNKSKDAQYYHTYFVSQRFTHNMDRACSILFGISKVASNFITLRLMGYRLLRIYVHARGNDKNIIEDLIREGIDEKYLLSDIETNFFSSREIRNHYFSYMADNLAKYKERLLEKQEDSSYEILFKKYYDELKAKDIDVALEGLKSKYKSVQKLSREFFLGKVQYNQNLENLLKTKIPKANQEVIEYIIDYNKLQKLDIENITLDAIVEEFYVPKKMEKVIAKLEIDEFPKVRYEKEEKEASKELLNYYLGTFLLSPTVELPLTASIIKDRLNKEDLNNLGRFVYNKWFGLGAVAKMKMAMVFAVYNSDEAFMMDFKKQVDEWTINARGAIASEGVKAMAFHGSDYALMELDAISRKYKNKMVKNTAAEYFLIAAKNMGLSKEELADRVIPNLGFDERKQMELDYGSRIFIATLKEDLTIQLTNPDKKVIKTLPKPTKSDDEEIAKASKKHLTAIKKQLKTVVASQKLRLERGIFMERRWDMETFQKVFVTNPVMHMFAVNLVWGKYDEKNQLISSFRYMADGTFADADYEEIILEEKDEIGLIHPLDLTVEAMEIWKENLRDNEIIQPIQQLEIEKVTLDEKQMGNTVYEEFKGFKLPAISLTSKLEKQGWYKTSIVDGGGYEGLYIEFEELKYGAQINAENLYIGMGDETTTVAEVRFYKKGTIQRGSYVYDDINDANIAKLSEVEPKFLQAVITQLRDICKK